ncbi:MAG: ABC transporter substrate-binding protein [Alphaproteobacteria bacterium]|nr:ABC transporter substrate-binding protein [Alphaproteobacteria bacterium]
MKSNIFLHFITGCVMFLLIGNLHAKPISNEEAVSFAETKGKELLDVFQEDDLKKRYETLDKMVMEYVDIEHISRFVIGKYWRVMTPEQKQKYEKVFTRYGLALYKTLPLEYAKDIKYEIMSTNSDDKYTNVLANVKFMLNKELQEVTVSFRLHKVNDKIKIVDVKVAESSLLLSYRGKFYEMIAQSDGEIDWFLEDFADMTVSIEQNLLQKANDQQKSLEIDDKTR